ncbi:E4 ORF4 [Titi monkey adenovirus ECC-2011]|uniref:E4 ORF4 n=1 Tax=titi monkey adenovirus 1 TaxID=3123084 RepID=G0ZAK1_9ADEN|nr:E4 ORF4 [Titi monkey adenovirus ECC-2011]AEK98472.1 E4 ORF4 [Titi monkey adenovirus ECC-2011]
MVPFLPAVPAPPLVRDRHSALDWLRGTRALVDDLIAYCSRTGWELTGHQWRLLTGLSQLLAHAAYFERQRVTSPSRRVSPAAWQRAFFCFRKYNLVRRQLDQQRELEYSCLYSSSSSSHGSTEPSTASGPLGPFSSASATSPGPRSPSPR